MWNSVEFRNTNKIIQWIKPTGLRRSDEGSKRRCRKWNSGKDINGNAYRNGETFDPLTALRYCPSSPRKRGAPRLELKSVVACHHFLRRIRRAQELTFFFFFFLPLLEVFTLSYDFNCISLIAFRFSLIQSVCHWKKTRWNLFLELAGSRDPPPFSHDADVTVVVLSFVFGYSIFRR